MKNLILTMCLLLVVSFTYAQLHVTKNTAASGLNGAVGIGTPNPTEMLDVSGNISTGGNSSPSRIRVGKTRTLDGQAIIELFSLKGEAATTSFSSTIELLEDKTNKMVSSFIHNGNGHFQLATNKENSDIRFLTKKSDPKQSKISMIITPGKGYVGIGAKIPEALLHIKNILKDGIPKPNQVELLVDGEAIKRGGGQWAVTSDKRTKKNINEYTKGLEEVLKINPITYNYNGKAGVTDTESTFVGLIAQEFAEIDPSAVKPFSFTETGSNKTEEFLSMDASSIQYMLVNGMKEQQALIEAQKAALETLKTEVAELKANGASINTPGASEMSVLLEGSGTESALLAQNSPNPFTTKTRIEYFIPQNSKHCRLSFRDMNGKELKQVNIEHEGIGAIDLSAKDLAAGIYSYVLYVNGDIVASKKMILRQ